RALELLEGEGLFTLADVADPTICDVAENPKNIELVELDAAQLVRSLQDLDAAVVNGHFALEAGLSAASDSIGPESGEDNPYADPVAVRSEDVDDPALVALDRALRSEETRAFFEERWPDGEVIPAF